MNVLITGMNGTVAPFVADWFKQKDHHILSYDREKVSTDNLNLIKDYFIKHNIELCLHFAMGSVEWTGLLARISYDLNVKFIYISTVSVFSDEQFGPYHVTDIPKPDSEYGIYKRQSELIAKKENPKVYILRLGWQIGYDFSKNQMLHFLKQQMEEKGFIEASSKWYPSASFLEDTAKAIGEICLHHPPDLYLINSNHSYTFYEIAKNLSLLYPEFIIKETTDFEADHRMIDLRVPIKKFREIVWKRSE